MHKVFQQSEKNLICQQGFIVKKEHNILLMEMRSFVIFGCLLLCSLSYHATPLLTRFKNSSESDVITHFHLSVIGLKFEKDPFDPPPCML